VYAAWLLADQPPHTILEGIHEERVRLVTKASKGCTQASLYDPLERPRMYADAICHTGGTQVACAARPD